MIAVVTSALMAIALGETEADACIRVLETETEVMISAGTVAETLIVAAGRNVGEEMTRLIDGLGFEIVSVTPASGRRIAAAYARWGRGAHPAGLNLGDCFSDEVANEHVRDHQNPLAHPAALAPCQALQLCRPRFDHYML